MLRYCVFTIGMRIINLNSITPGARKRILYTRRDRTLRASSGNRPCLDNSKDLDELKSKSFSAAVVDNNQNSVKYFARHSESELNF